MEWMINKNTSSSDKKHESYMDFVSDIFGLFQFLYLSNQKPETDHIIRMRGMPFEAGAPEIVQFFEGKLSLEKVLFHT